MLKVNSISISNYVDSFLSNMTISEIDDTQLEDLKKYLINFLEDLYQKNPQDIISLIEQTESINPFMFKIVLSYGILEEDVLDIVKYMLVKINEFFYKKGSFEVLKYIQTIFNYYNLSSEIKKVIYSKDDDSWYLEDVYTGERVKSERKEFLTSGHLVTKKKYSEYTFSHDYHTIVVHISINLSAKVNDDMQNPVALLQAYSISKHKNDTITMSAANETYDLELQDFLFFLQYLTLRYIKIKNKDYEINNSDETLFDLSLLDDDDLDSARELLSTFLSGGYQSRSGLAYFLRASNFILSKYKFQSDPNLKLANIKEDAHQRNYDLANAIDNMTTVEEIEDSINTTLVYAEFYIDSLPKGDIVADADRDTIYYLIMFVVFIITSDYEKRLRNMLHKIKRYFLPVYTQFVFDVTKTFKIYNNFFRVFTEDKSNILLALRHSDLLDLSDEQKIILDVMNKYNLNISDKDFIYIRTNVFDNEKLSDKIKSILASKSQGIIETRDQKALKITPIKKDINDLLDRMSADIRSKFTEKELKILDKVKNILASKSQGIIETRDQKAMKITSMKKDSSQMVDHMSSKIYTRMLEKSINRDDSYSTQIFSRTNSTTKSDDKHNETVESSQSDHNDTLDSVTTTVTKN